MHHVIFTILIFMYITNLQITIIIPGTITQSIFHFFIHLLHISVPDQHPTTITLITVTNQHIILTISKHLVIMPHATIILCLTIPTNTNILDDAVNSDMFDGNEKLGNSGY